MCSALWRAISPLGGRFRLWIPLCAPLRQNRRGSFSLPWFKLAHHGCCPGVMTAPLVCNNWTMSVVLVLGRCLSSTLFVWALCVVLYVNPGRAFYGQKKKASRIVLEPSRDPHRSSGEKAFCPKLKHTQFLFVLSSTNTVNVTFFCPKLNNQSKRTVFCPKLENTVNC